MTSNSRKELSIPFSIRISAENVLPSLITNNLSFTLAPTLYPWVKVGGGESSVSNPRMYKCVDTPTLLVTLTSIPNQSTLSSSSTFALGGIMWVINALLSLSNASFLNPSETNDSCPKLEFELVIDASPPDSQTKCLLNPIANTDTICMIASFEILMWVVSHPFL